MIKKYSVFFSAVLDDFFVARQEFPDDRVFETMHKALQLSQDALIYDTDQLAPQMLDRLASQKVEYLFL